MRQDTKLQQPFVGVGENSIFGRQTQLHSFEPEKRLTLGTPLREVTSGDNFRQKDKTQKNYLRASGNQNDEAEKKLPNSCLQKMLMIELLSGEFSNLMRTISNYWENFSLMTMRISMIAATNLAST